jgi:hypothetical protein
MWGARVNSGDESGAPREVSDKARRFASARAAVALSRGCQAAVAKFSPVNWDRGGARRAAACRYSDHAGKGARGRGTMASWPVEDFESPRRIGDDPVLPNLISNNRRRPREDGPEQHVRRRVRSRAWRVRLQFGIEEFFRIARRRSTLRQLLDVEHRVGDYRVTGSNCSAS